MYCQQPPQLARVPLQFMVGDLSTSPPAGRCVRSVACVLRSLPESASAVCLRPWCKRWTLVPGLYSFVQQEYWGNGLLAYYEWKQVCCCHSVCVCVCVRVCVCARARACTISHHNTATP